MHLILIFIQCVVVLLKYSIIQLQRFTHFLILLHKYLNKKQFIGTYEEIGKRFQNLDFKQENGLCYCLKQNYILFFLFVPFQGGF